MSALTLALVAGWLAVGVVGVAVMRRRGHDSFAWAVPFVVLGPLAVPMAIAADRQRPADPARHAPGGLDLLVADDGTDDSRAALDAALELFGAQMTSMTLAAVVDLEASSTVRGEQTRRQAQERLDALAREASARTAAPVETIILFGEPARALQRHALENGYELIVAGRRWATKQARLRSRPSAPARSVPVLVGPA